MSANHGDFSQITDRVLALLRQHPDGIGEYDILKTLQQDGIAPFATLEFSNSLMLFRAHFILYHCLYRLRDRLHAEREWRLEISPLVIALAEWLPGEEALGHYDALREYYGDLDKLEQTGEQEVKELLVSFWRRMAGIEGRVEALTVLGLDMDADQDSIRRRYRQLVMEHHPDRGGDKERLQEINKAAQLLLGK